MITCVNLIKRIADMNWNEIQSNWKMASEQIKRTWGKLSEDDLTAIAGQRSQLVAVLQQKYGNNAADAERRVDQFAKRLSC